MTHQTDEIVKYVFIVRQKSMFDGGGVIVDSLYKVDETKKDDAARTIAHMQMRTRFNPDCFPHVIMVSGENLEFTFESLDEYLNAMETDELADFLEKGSIT